jgi:hypothetical protein
MSGYSLDGVISIKSSSDHFFDGDCKSESPFSWGDEDTKLDGPESTEHAERFLENQEIDAESDTDPALRGMGLSSLHIWLTHLQQRRQDKQDSN